MIELVKWRKMDNYLGEDMSEYYIVASRNYNSELWEESNFAVATKRLGGENPPKVIIGHFSHWMVKWIECLLVHESAEEELAIARDIIHDLNEYPILDEDHYDSIRERKIEEWIIEIRKDVDSDIEDGKTFCRMWDIDLTTSRDEIEEKIYEEAYECAR